ncbi:MAG: CapA family protein [Patescibacteria group bacterium]|nr:CapA family protein [Patescibacteria group bacterium]
MKKYWIIILTSFVMLLCSAAVFSLVVFGSPRAQSDMQTDQAISITIPETIVKSETIAQSPQKETPVVVEAIDPVMIDPPIDVIENNQEDVSLLFLGDTMLGRYVETRSQRARDTAYTFRKMVNDENNFFANYDAVIANLEGPVTAKIAAPDKGEVDFAFDPAIAPMLKQIGVTAVSQANNHTLDQGRAGADESRKLLTEAGVKVFGDQVRDDAESSLTVIETNGQKVALLGFNITDNPLNYTDAEASLKSAYEQARYVVVYIHWGAEYQSKPNMTQIGLAHWFIDNGVDAVIGGHPHWMQSVEVYNNRPIIYSLGNFIFDQDWSVETNYGLVAGLSLNPDGTDVHLFPVQIIKSQPQILEGADRQTRLDRLANISHESLKEQIKSGTIKLY